MSDTTPGRTDFSADEEKQMRQPSTLSGGVSDDDINAAVKANNDKMQRNTDEINAAYMKNQNPLANRGGGILREDGPSGAAAIRKRLGTDR